MGGPYGGGPLGGGGGSSLDAGLASLTGVDTAADKMPYTTAADVWAALATTSFGRSLLATANASALATAAGFTTGAGSLAAFTLIKNTTNYSNATQVASSIPGLTFPPVAGAKYLWIFFAMSHASAATNGAQFGIDEGNPANATVLWIGRGSSQSTITTYAGVLDPNDRVQATSSIVDADDSRVPTWGMGMIEADPTAPTAFTWQCQSEEAAAATTYIDTGHAWVLLVRLE